MSSPSSEKLLDVENLQYQRHNDTHFIIFNSSEMADLYRNSTPQMTDYEEGPIEPLTPEFK